LYLDKERWMPESSAQNGAAELAGDLANSLLAVLRTLPDQSPHHARHLSDLAAHLTRSLLGHSELAVAARDRRFDHPAWQTNPMLRRALQSWLGCNAHYRQWLNELEVPEPDRARLRQLGDMLSATLAPSNSPANPVFIERLRQTRGGSLCQGTRNLLTDLVLGRPMAPLCADGAFKVGRDLASTPGQVIQREPLFELIQYRPTTPQTHERALLMVPPPLNRFYLLDLTERASLVRHALDQGLQVFMISWRNPDPDHREWGFNQYVNACNRALQTASSLTANGPVNLMGVCAGGLLALLLQGVLQSRGQGHRISSASYLVTPIDARLDTGLVRMLGPAARQQLRTRLWKHGFLPARELARAFSWQRPEEFVWPQMLERYALGQDPRPRDVLSWSQDCTRLPARLVEDLMDYFERDPFARPGSLVVQGQAVDLSSITTPSWHLGAQHDHIVPCANSFPLRRMGGDKTFVQSHSGHIQSLVNPQQHPGAWFRAGTVADEPMKHWLQQHGPVQGSWRTHWGTWVKKHSGGLGPAPAILGSSDFPPLQAAPGRYVHKS
tara:strand:- start:4490 stop:6151 length:1662 start_codon:yes stop_codon:yes gene_type:complete